MILAFISPGHGKLSLPDPDTPQGCALIFLVFIVAAVWFCFFRKR
jgi:hypothetical protein